MQIIPAIDLLDSKCVRLVKGDFDQVTIYNNNPLDQIKLFEDHGIKKVHIVDLDAAKSGLSTSNTKLIKNIASSTNIEIQVGGGIRSIDKANEFYDIGVSKIIIGTAGIESAEFLTNLLTTFNSEFVIAGLDFNVKNKIPYLAINGWTKSTSINLYTFLESLPEIKNILATDISVDGTMEGSNIFIYKEILDRFPDINLIGSGGVSCIKDINNLKQIGLNECVVGKAYYEGKIKMHEMIYVN